MLLELGMYTTHILYGVTCNFLYLHRFNREWDITLNSWLDMVEDGELRSRLGHLSVDKFHTLILEGTDFFKGVWVSNKQYSYGNLYYTDSRWNGAPESQQHRPSIHTMIRLEKLVQKLEKEYKDSQKLTTEQLYK